MALAKPSPVITAVSGPVGGAEFFRFGAQIRIASRRCKPISTTQRSLNARANHTSAIATWHSLTSAQLNGFTALANRMNFKDRYGTTRKLSPFQLFLHWYPWCKITQPIYPVPFFDPPVTDFTSPGPGTVSLTMNTTPYAEITTTGGLFFFFLSWWHYDLFGPHSRPGLKPKQWQTIANTRMWAYTQDVTTDFTTAGIPFIEGATYSLRLRVYVWRNWPSTYVSTEATCTAP